MAQRKLVKKIAYITIICLSAIAAVILSQTYSHKLFTNQTNLPNNTMANAAQLNLQEFPIGWIDRVERPQTPTTVSEEGINLLIPYTHSYEQPAIEAYLDAAQQNGIKVFLEPYRKDVKAEDADAIAEFVRTYKDHPAVAGWYSYDEPVLNKVSAETLEITYQAIKSEDPNRPVTIVFAPEQGAKALRYRNALDIYGIDRYPLFFGKPEFNNLSDFGKWMQKAASYAGDKEFFPVLQAYGEKENGEPQFNRRLPTAAEERYMFYTAITAGADGLMFYGHHLTQQSWIDSVLTPIIKEFRGYLPLVRSDRVSETFLTNRSDIQTVLYQNPTTQQYLLIAIHHGKGQVTAKIEPQVSVSNNQVQVSEENRSLNLTQGAFEDTFNDYEVHIYVIS